MDRNILIIRQHAFTILPDGLLFVAGSALFLEIPAISSHFPSVAEDLLAPACEWSGSFLIAVGMIHFLAWMGFRLEITPWAITVRRWFVLERTIAMRQPGVRLNIRQRSWERWLNKGTLVLYTPDDGALVFDHLADFDRLWLWVASHPLPRGRPIMTHPR
ncbi:MAG TPA: hypothetical protein ENK60_06070 [Anaerolineae bacterium]|nr:hypothetical protein [Anaerolineae bacterium]